MIHPNNEYMDVFRSLDYTRLAYQKSKWNV
jgi:hypothetical protein